MRTDLTPRHRATDHGRFMSFFGRFRSLFVGFPHLRSHRKNAQVHADPAFNRPDSFDPSPANIFCAASQTASAGSSLALASNLDPSDPS